MPSLELEFALYKRGIAPVAGIDEAGRGSLAGPVVSAAVILPSKFDVPTIGPQWLQVIDDSKRLSRRKREAAYELVRERAMAVGIGAASSQEIDKIGIVDATALSMSRAISDLPIEPSHLLVDYVTNKDFRIPADVFVHGDALSYSIAAASIVAKVTRDRLMQDLNSVYPGYDLGQHKGYGTASHIAAIRINGPSAIHRLSFNKVNREAS